jgi:hypothetical protein
MVLPPLQRAVVGATLLATLLTTLGGVGLACGAFSLNGVVDGGGLDAQGNDASRDGGSADSSSNSDSDAPSDAASCDAASPCACLPAVTTIIAGIHGVGAVTVDENYVYWVAPSGGKSAIFRLPVGTTNAASIPAPSSGTFALPGGRIVGLPFDAKNFFLALEDTHYLISTVAVDSDGGAKVVELTPHFDGIPVDVLAGDKGVYWTDNTSEICFAYLDGGFATKGDSGCGAQPLAPEADSGGTLNNTLALSPTAVYQSIYKTGEIRWVSSTPAITSHAKLLLRRSPNEARTLYATATELIFSESGASGCIFHSSANGTGVTQLVGDAGPIGSFVVDATHIFYAVDYPDESPSTTIYYVPRDGGASTLLACDPQPEYLAEDATYIYWWSLDDNDLHRVAKPP